MIPHADERGNRWPSQVRVRLAEAERRWSLTLLPAFSNLSYNYAAPVVLQDGTAAVLKVCLPNAELHTEVAALQAYDGRNSVRLIDSDSEQGLLLLERLSPGIPLTTLANEANDEKATAIAASVMRGLWRPVPPDHHFPTIADWGEGFTRLRHRFHGGTGPLPIRLVEEAETLFREFLATAAEPVLLHGDLHHDNILAAERQPWLAIDPKGVIGEPAYEVGALVRNLWEDRHTLHNPARILERRISQLAADLYLDRARVRGWCVAQAVLSAWWCLEDSVDCWEHAISVAQLLVALPR